MYINNKVVTSNSNHKYVIGMILAVSFLFLCSVSSVFAGGGGNSGGNNGGGFDPNANTQFGPDQTATAYGKTVNLKGNWYNNPVTAGGLGVNIVGNQVTASHTNPDYTLSGYYNPSTGNIVGNWQYNGGSGGNNNGGFGAGGGGSNPGSCNGDGETGFGSSSGCSPTPPTSCNPNTSGFNQGACPPPNSSIAYCTITPAVTIVNPGEDVTLNIRTSKSTNNGTSYNWTLNGSRLYSGQGGGSNYRDYQAGVLGSKLTKSGTYSVQASFTNTGHNNYSCQALIVVEDNKPTANLKVRNTTTGSSWTGNNITINYGQQIALNWSSTNAASCTASGSSFSTGNKTEGTDTSIGEPGSGNRNTYKVTCSSIGGSASDQLTVTTRPRPTATLQVRNTTTGTSWTGSNITIEPTEQIALNWSSTNSNTCSGTNFSTGNSTGGTQNSVTEANPGANKTFTVSCSGAGGSASDSLRVTTRPWDPVSIEVDPGYVRSGESADIEWILGNNPAEMCTITGPNVSGSLASYTSPHTVSINGESSFTINCPGGSDTATVRILPTIEET